jgi:putative glutamine amidotransferase
VPTEKQDLDVELARAAIELGRPVLGICYGMQLLALVEGGSFYQHLPEDLPGSRDHSGGVVHEVELRPETKLARALRVDRLDVVSRHHQAVAALGPKWRTAAVDDQGLIEGIERADHPFALGVQWHPELAQPGSPDERLFEALIEAASAPLGVL